MSGPDDERFDDVEVADTTRFDGEMPDLVAMRADDALLDALGSPDPSTDLNDELGALLLAWRQETDSEPVPELVDTDGALAVIASARTATTRRKHRFLVPVASAAAVLAIAFTGVGLAAKGAQPGDTLWGLTKVLYAEHAQSVEAAGTVRSDLDEARLAMGRGDYGDARAALDRARHKLDSVAGDDGRKDLDNDRQTLLDRLDGRSPSTPDSPSSTTGVTRPSTPPVTEQPTDPGTSEPSVPPESTSPSEPPPSDSATPTPPDTGGGEQSGGAGSGGDQSGGGWDSGTKPGDSTEVQTGTN